MNQLILLAQWIARPRTWLLAGMAALNAGCATQSLDLAPASASEPWVAPGAKNQAKGDFTVAPRPEVAVLSPPPALSSSHQYTLPELIDIAQNQNPDTRIAWQQARQAALAVGIGEAVFLPMLSASVVGGYQSTRTPLAYDIEDHSDIDTHGSAIVPALAFQWLIFDFGQRSALLEAAHEGSWAANVAFNGIHQKIIYTVTQAYYQYEVAKTQTRLSGQRLKNSLEIREAARSRRQQGIATSVEVALAEQQVAQSEMRSVVAQGHETEAYQALLNAMGVSPALNIQVSYAGDRTLPDSVTPPTERMIRNALAQRPDVQASYAAAKAAKAGIRAAEADFLPKVYLAGAVAGGSGHFDIQGMPGISQQTSSSSILLGVSVPLYDGGIRSARVGDAQSRSAIADEQFSKTQDAAAREIVMATETLRSALASNKAAINLEKTSFIAYDAALDSYRHGVGTVTVANEAANTLLEAQQMRAEAYAASLVAAANLAFVMGRMTSGSQAIYND
ncbi:TolC family protein [Enterobacteriaceae bacterium 89]|nr:TolC family protein [Enterobacteriaceae bacterium 89]